MRTITITRGWAAIAGMVCIVVSLCCLPDSARSQEPVDEGEWHALGSERSFQQGVISYQYLVGTEMNDVYGYVMTAYGAAGGWGLSDEGDIGHFGAKFDAGLMGGNGQAIPKTSAWQIDKADLSLLALPFDISGLWRLVDTGDKTFAVPFVGVGIGGIVGWEKLTVAISNSSAAAGWEHSNIRMSFAAHVSAGTYLFASKKYKGLIEAKYVVSGKSGYDNGQLTDEMKNAGFTEDILNVVARPDFDFSGPAVSVGLEW